MCGIYASLRFAPDRARIDVVAHRGPDGAGWREFDSAAGPVALGHRRLAIIDLSDEGLQPMADETGRYHLVFNGEIYNYLELRRELAARGRRFRSETDSEVLLAAYAEWGEGCLDRLRGMFAFLVWDDRDKRLFAARDRFGIKPLYFVMNGSGAAFASEIKQLIGLPGLTGRMNRARVRDYLAAGIADHTAETMFEGVRQLRPGSCMALDAARPWTAEALPRRWYAIPAAASLDLSEAEAGERFRELLSDAVRLHLRSDVPVGSCLSGGLDSSSIVCLMSRMLAAEGNGATVKTVSACYADASVDEKPFVEAVIRKSGAEPHYVYPRPEDVFASASDITWHQDEPFGSTSIFAQSRVFAEAQRAGIKVMLDGQGADEMLAGYHWCFGQHLADLARRGRIAAAFATMLERRRLHGAAFMAQAAQMAGALLPTSARAIVLGRREAWVSHGWLSSPAFGELADGRSVLELAAAANGLPPVTDLASLCVSLTFASNLQMLLHWEDRNSMAHSVEARVPFLDHPLVEFALALGGSHKIVGSDTKRVLRRAMADTLPAPVRDRRDKLGFATPEQAWLRGPLRRPIEQGVEATLRRYPDLLNAHGVRRLSADMLDGRRPVDVRLWRIVNLGIWGERLGVGL